MKQLLKKCIQKRRDVINSIIPSLAFSSPPKEKCLFIRPLDNEEPMLQAVKGLYTMFGGSREDYNVKMVSNLKKKREELMKLLPESLDELPPRKMKDSLITALIPLKTNVRLRDRFLSYTGNLRIGRVLEVMDIFAVNCGYTHIVNPKTAAKTKFSPHILVTASVDSIHVNNAILQNDEDIRLSAHVTYAGRSVIEVSMIAEQIHEGGSYEQMFEAIFVMAARNPLGTGPAFVNPLVADTEEEAAFLQRGINRQKRRTSVHVESLSRMPPNEEEREIIHKAFIQQSNNFEGTTENSIEMSNASLNTIMLCHPQYRNPYHKIFGGFLMRQAFELAYTSTYVFSHSVPRIAAIDDIKFLSPVEIGSFLSFRATIGYVEDNYIHNVVHAEVINPKTSKINKSNVCHFTFRLDNPTMQIPTVKFTTYKEAMFYLSSRRHFRKIMTQYGIKLSSKQ